MRKNLFTLQARSDSGERIPTEAASMSLPAFVRAMLEPGFYPHGPSEVTLIQTHISYVFLAGPEVYKVKKPVRFSFLDFSTVARRRHFCDEEVRLNRRLAPDMYRGVVAVCAAGTGFRLGSEDAHDAVEYAVHMRRLPEERTLDRLLDRGEVTPAMVDELAQILVRFHAQANGDDTVAAYGDPAALARVIEENFGGARPFRGVTISAEDDDVIQTFARCFLEGNDTYLRQRQAQRRIREGHGDLHTEHICCTVPPVIYDCIEFNRAFRCCDVASDIAFLVMDMTYHRHPDLAAQLIDRYAALANDAGLPYLVPFYACYRAYVRGKVDSLKSVEEEVDPREREAARESARRHFALATRYTWSYRPCLVVLTGLSSTGKSTIARALRERTGFTWISSDVVRKELAGLSPAARRPDAYDAGIYAPAFSRWTYDTMYERATRELSAGHGVILDATFQLKIGRTTAREIARARRVPLLLVECRLREAEVRRRIALRQQDNRDASDADWNVYAEQRRRFEPFDEHDEGDRLVLDTDDAAASLAARIEREIRTRLVRNLA